MALSFDEMVRSLTEQYSFTRERAEAIAREQLGAAAPPPAATIERDDSILEKQEQQEVTKRFTAFGFRVRNLSQARKTKQAPGLADLWVVHRELPIAFWWETKRQVGGRLSPAQLEFREDCVRCGVGYGSGDRYAADEYLIEIGLAYRTALNTLEPTRRTA